jgi:hypothetical protein
VRASVYISVSVCVLVRACASAHARVCDLEISQVTLKLCLSFHSHFISMTDLEDMHTLICKPND